MGDVWGPESVLKAKSREPRTLESERFGCSDCHNEKGRA